MKKHLQTLNTEKKKYTYPVRGQLRYKGVIKDVRAHNQADYLRKVEKLKKKIDATALSGQNLTVQEWAEKCIRDYKPKQREITKRKYMSRVRHCILDEIGNVPLSLVTTVMCQEVLDMQATKSQAQINEVYNALRFIFRRAVIANHISIDPTLNLEKPKGYATKRRALTSLERRSVLDVAPSNRRYYFALLMLLCGCRSSEAIACKGKDIIEIEVCVQKHVRTRPLKGPRIFSRRINHKINAISSGNGIISNRPFDKVIEMYNTYPALHIEGTKTENAVRDVPIPEELYLLIKDTPPDEYIAQDTNGNQMTETSRRNAWRALKKEISKQRGLRGQLGDDLCPYCLRHEFCTELGRKGVDLRIAQKLMGHSSISLTANIYSNLRAEDFAYLSNQLGFNTALKRGF